MGTGAIIGTTAGAMEDAVCPPTAQAKSKCTNCGRIRTLEHFSARAKSTCDTCVAKKKRQRASKQQNNRDKTDNLHGENSQFTGVIANQQEEIERLRSALNVLREGRARVSSQVLNQLHVDPSDTAAISTLLDS